jgi:photosystem II stability/assembly factor-like uncharacterized protein
MLTEGELKSEFRAALEAVTPPAPWLSAKVKEGLRAEQRRRWRDRVPRELQISLNAAAILLLVVLAVATLGVFLVIHRSTVPARPGIGSVIVPIKMVSSTVGWGSTADALVRTSDGGSDWTDVSPPGWRYDPYFHRETDFFLDADHAWVAQTSAASLQIDFFRTSDGGRTWQQVASISGSDVGFLPTQLDFLDPFHGWFAGTKPGLGLGLYSTNDGGHSWEPVAVHPGLQDSGCSSMAFRSVSTGWIACTSAGGESVLLVTHDSGANWAEQMLPLPTKNHVAFDPPVFFDQTHGIFVLHDDPAALFVTSDGGASWELRWMPGTSGLGPVDFIDMMHGWAIFGGELQSTDDGGWNWAYVRSNLNLSSGVDPVGELYFFNQKIGFAVLYNLDSNVPQLLKTTDGGHSWTVLATT